MAAPTYAQLSDPTQGGPGFSPEPFAQRLLTIVAMIASGQNPDGTPLPSTLASPFFVASTFGILPGNSAAANNPGLTQMAAAITAAGGGIAQFGPGVYQGGTATTAFFTQPDNCFVLGCGPNPGGLASGQAFVPNQGPRTGAMVGTVLYNPSGGNVLQSWYWGNPNITSAGQMVDGVLLCGSGGAFTGVNHWISQVNATNTNGATITFLEGTVAAQNNLDPITGLTVGSINVAVNAVNVNDPALVGQPNPYGGTITQAQVITVAGGAWQVNQLLNIYGDTTASSNTNGSNQIVAIHGNNLALYNAVGTSIAGGATFAQLAGCAECNGKLFTYASVSGSTLVNCYQLTNGNKGPAQASLNGEILAYNGQGYGAAYNTFQPFIDNNVIVANTPGDGLIHQQAAGSTIGGWWRPRRIISPGRFGIKIGQGCTDGLVDMYVTKGIPYGFASIGCFAGDTRINGVHHVAGSHCPGVIIGAECVVDYIEMDTSIAPAVVLDNSGRFAGSGGAGTVKIGAVHWTGSGGPSSLHFPTQAAPAILAVSASTSGSTAVSIRESYLPWLSPYQNGPASTLPTGVPAITIPATGGTWYFPAVNPWGFDILPNTVHVTPTSLGTLNLASTTVQLYVTSVTQNTPVTNGVAFSLPVNSNTLPAGVTLPTSVYINDPGTPGNIPININITSVSTGGSGPQLNCSAWQGAANQLNIGETVWCGFITLAGFGAGGTTGLSCAATQPSLTQGNLGTTNDPANGSSSLLSRWKWGTTFYNPQPNDVVIASAARSVNGVQSGYNLLDSDDTVVVTGVGAVTLNLPNQVGRQGRQYFIFNNAGGNLTVSGQTVAAGHGIVFISDGANWQHWP